MCLWCELTSFSVLEHILLFSFVQWSEVVKKKCFFWCDNVIRKYIHKRKNINNFFTCSFFGLLIGCVVLFWRSFHFHSVFHSFIFILLFSFFFYYNYYMTNILEFLFSWFSPVSISVVFLHLLSINLTENWNGTQIQIFYYNKFYFSLCSLENYTLHCKTTNLPSPYSLSFIIWSVFGSFPYHVCLFIIVDTAFSFSSFFIQSIFITSIWWMFL